MTKMDACFQKFTHRDCRHELTPHNTNGFAEGKKRVNAERLAAVSETKTPFRTILKPI
jgi:hypothetical protein